jgi:hypothetical protein
MRASRPISFVLTCLFVFTLLLVLVIIGCEKRLVVSPGQRVLDCGHAITVQTTSVQPVFVCDDSGFSQITWTPGSNVKSFSVQFLADCPFVSCAGITYPGSTASAPISTVKSQPTPVKVYKYSIDITDTSNNTVHLDPHVVGGGHN